MSHVKPLTFLTFAVIILFSAGYALSQSSGQSHLGTEICDSNFCVEEGVVKVGNNPDGQGKVWIFGNDGTSGYTENMLAMIDYASADDNRITIGTSELNQGFLRLRITDGDGFSINNKADDPVLFVSKTGKSVDVNGEMLVNAKSNIDGVGGNYKVSEQRYHIEASSLGNNYVPLDHSILTELCRDEDGCTYSIGYYDNEYSSLYYSIVRGPFKFLIRESDNRWRDWDNYGRDGTGTITHVWSYGGCHFTDRDIDGTDDAEGFGLYNTNEEGMDKYCFLTIDD